MCTFNTLLLPASASIDAVNAISRRVLGRTFAAQNNRAIEAALGEDSRSFVRAQGDCDCGERLGKLSSPTSATSNHREIRKLRERGWGDAKIERWIADRARAEDKRERSSIAHAAPATDAEWTELVRTVLDQRAAAWIGLFTHEYRGAIDTEQVTCRVAQRIRGVTLAQIETIARDTIYVFEP